MIVDARPGVIYLPRTDTTPAGPYEKRFWGVVELDEQRLQLFRSGAIRLMCKDENLSVARLTKIISWQGRGSQSSAGT